jgi:uncharacterized Zn finger protein
MSKIVEELTCPECGSEDFLKGPCGGMAVNVKCSKCGHFMNIVPLPKGKIWIVEGAEKQ